MAQAESKGDERRHVDAIFARWDTTKTPGCALLVLNDGKPLYSRSYGMADLSHGIPISPTTVFHVASISKQFTATAVLLLAQDSKLSLDDDVRKYVPELPDYGTPITLRQLASHTSGLRDQWDLLKWAGWRFADDLITDDDVMRLITRQRSLNFTPGSEFAYSNSGFTLLTHVVKRVSRQSLREFTKQRIFEPLAMRDTYFRDNHADIVPRLARGYDNQAVSEPHFDTVGPSSLLTTVEDLARWDANFYAPRVGDAAFLQDLQRPAKLTNGKDTDYALGLEVDDYRGLRIVEHSGRDPGYRSDILRFPEQHFTVICLCNTQEVVTRDVSRRVADIYLHDQFKSGRPPDEPEKTAPAFTPKDLESYVGEYHSDEVDATYTIAIDGQRLALRSPKLRPTILKPLTPDTFESPMGQLTFTRDGFTVSTDEGLRALRFSKRQ